MRAAASFLASLGPLRLTGLALALVLVLFGLACHVQRSSLASLVRARVAAENALTPHTRLLAHWLDPPLTPRLSVFVFNLTNHEAFLAGEAPPILHELGPFVYVARQERVADAWSVDQSVVTFRSRTNYTFLPDESVSLDTDTFVIVPNIVFLTGMLKTDVQRHPGFVKQHIVWPILNSAGPDSPQPFRRLTVAEFLWEHEEELACLQTGDENEEEEEDNLLESFFDDLWEDDDEDKDKKSTPVKKKTPFNYRADDGRCLFGALRTLNATWRQSVRIRTGAAGRLADRGQIVDIDGRRDFGVWRPDSECDVFAGSQEPTALPAEDDEGDDEFRLHLGVMCRWIKMRKAKERPTSLDDLGFDVDHYAAHRETFDFSSDDNECFEKAPVADGGLPDGAMSLERCLDGAPIVVSFPHFLHADSWYTNSSQILGPSDANYDDHHLYIDLEPTLGTPVSAQIRFQLNLHLRPDSNFPPLARLNGPTVLPMFWVQEGFESLGGPGNVALLRLALRLPGIVPGVLSAALIALGAALALASCCCCCRPGRRRRRTTTAANPAEKEQFVAPAPNLAGYDKVPRAQSETKFDR